MSIVDNISKKEMELINLAKKQKMVFGIGAIVVIGIALKFAIK